jgi:phosphomannomutase
VLPDVSGPVFHVRAESRDQATAQALVMQYAQEIERLQAEL